MNEIVKGMDYNGHSVRTVLRDDGVWWVLRDVCSVLGLTSTKRTVDRLDTDEVNQTHLVDARGCLQVTYIINESGLYSVLLRSDKPEAKSFKRWVTHDVLPSIRKTGQYISPQEEEKKKRFQFADVPENQDAQKIMKEMEALATSIHVMLHQYNCYRPEDERKGYAGVIEGICGSLYMKSADLGRIKHKTVYRP